MRPSHPKPVQPDLFGPPGGGQPPETPPWRSLPQGTRRRATVLVARMLLQHRASQSAEPGAANTGEGSDA